MVFLFFLGLPLIEGFIVIDLGQRLPSRLVSADGSHKCVSTRLRPTTQNLRWRVKRECRIRLQSENSPFEPDTSSKEILLNSTSTVIRIPYIFPEVEWSQYAWFMLALPSLANIFPYLIQSASSSTVPEEKRFLIILLLILKRVYLYAIALSTVDIAARRSVNLPPELGKRLQQLNNEILGSSATDSEERNEVTKSDNPLIARRAPRTGPHVRSLFSPATTRARARVPPSLLPP